MVVNNGFLVKNDRFSLTDQSIYMIFGWLKEQHTLKAFINGTEYPVTVEMLTDTVDERFGGASARALITIPKTAPKKGVLKLYALGAKARHLAFETTMQDVHQKMHPIKTFFDDCTVNTKDGLVHIQGWAAAKEPVAIELLDQNKKPMETAVERYQRYDVVDLFSEYKIDPKCGFNIELRPIPKGAIYIRFIAGNETKEEICLTGAFFAKVKKAGRLWDKGIKYLKYNGMPALADKVYNKLFNPAMKAVNYSEWIERHLPSERVLSEQRAKVWDNRPLISIVVPLYKTPEKYLRELVESVQAQTYSNWELVLSDGSPCENSVSPMKAVLDELSAKEKRITVVENQRQLKIAENTNAGIAKAKGSYIAFLDHDDVLTPDALYEMVQAVNRHPEAEFIYSDEDKVGVGNQYFQPNLKPDFDLDFLRSVNYICHFLMVKKTLIDRVGMLNPEFDGAQDYDFNLRCIEKTENIVHIPRILYHWRFFEGSTAANPESKLYAFEAGRRAIQAHYDRLGIPAEVQNGAELGIYRTVYHWKEQPLVSVLIPNKDHAEDLKKSLRGMLSGKGWQNFEIIIIENNSTEEETFAYYEELKKTDPRIRIVTYEGSFNYSKINNFGAQFAKGDYLLLLNNDTEFITEDAIGELMGFCMRDDVGAVGARLYYGDNTIQHAGVIVGWGGIAGHAFVNQLRGATGYQHRIICQQNYSAETAACLMVKRSVFDAVGGFTEELAVAFNDIDLCLKIRKAGYLIVYNPYCELYHYESKSRGLDTGDPEKELRFAGEIKTFQKFWPEILRDGDPYYNPNLSMVTQDFSLKNNK